MNLCLMRVCEFGTGSEPALTDKGKRQAALMAAFLKRQIGRVDIVISGTEAAAIETGEVMAAALGSYVATTTLMGPGGVWDKEGRWAEIERLAQQSQEVLLIMSEDGIDYWTEATSRMPYGAVAMLSDAVSSFGGDIEWLVTPALIESTEELIEAAQELSQFMEKSTVRHGPDYTYETVPMKRWNLGDGGASGNCELCEDNEAQGWIPEDEAFDSGDDDAPAHPNCTCDVERKDKRVRVYDA